MNKLRYHLLFNDWKIRVAAIALIGMVCVAAFVGCATYINMAETTDYRPLLLMGVSIIGLFFNQWLWNKFWNDLGEVDTK